MRMRRLFEIVPLSVFVVFAFVLGAPSVYADGDDFFAYQLRAVGDSGTNAGAKNGFLGSVKDDQGNYLRDATLTIQVTAPSDVGPVDVTYKSFTNVIGRYRTLDAGDVVSLLKGFDVVLKPSDVKLVGVTKVGYTQVQRVDRSRAGQAIREIDFVMKKVDN